MFHHFILCKNPNLVKVLNALSFARTWRHKFACIFSFLLTTSGLWDILKKEKSLKEKILEFFKDAYNWFKDMPDVFRGLLIAFFVVCSLLVLRYTVKMFYNKDKIKFTFIPIIAIIIMVAATVLLCVTA